LGKTPRLICGVFYLESDFLGELCEKLSALCVKFSNGSREVRGEKITQSLPSEIDKLLE